MAHGKKCKQSNNIKNKKKNNTKSNFILVIIPIIVGMIGSFIQICSYVNNKAEKKPTFTLDVTNISKQYTSNKKLIIHNAGGVISNAKLIPYMHLNLELHMGTNKWVDYIIEFTDFFNDNDYFYDSHLQQFVITEQNSDGVLLFMQDLERCLSENNIEIRTYAIQHYFEISYKNYKGNNCNDIYEIMNNHNYYMFSNHKGLQRYFNDNELIKIISIPKVDSTMPIINPSSIAEHIINSDIDWVEVDSFDVNGIADLQTTKKFGEFIEDNNGLMIGIKENLENN